MQNYIPKQNVRKVKGLQGAQKIMMDKESSILILDEDEPIIYFCQTDSFCNLSVDAYDITPHKTEEEIQTNRILAAIDIMNKRLERVEARLDESDTCEDVAENVTTAEPQTNKGNMEYAQLTGQSKRGYKPNDAKQSKGSRG